MPQSDLGQPRCKTCDVPIHSYPVTARCSRDGECWKCLVDKYGEALQQVVTLLTVGKGPKAVEGARQVARKALGLEKTRWVAYRIVPGSVTHRVEVWADEVSDVYAEARKQDGWTDKPRSKVRIEVYREDHLQDLVEREKTRPQCVGCGRCCQIRLCSVALMTHQANKLPCPSLVRDKDRYWCGIVLGLEEPEKTHMKQLLGIGTAQAEPDPQGCGFGREET